MSFGFISSPHFLKSVTQCSLPSGRIIRISCHWLTHSFKILACLLLADTVVSCQSVSQLSHQPRPVHWTCSVATWIVRSSGTNFPSHFVPKMRSVPWQDGSDDTAVVTLLQIARCQHISRPGPRSPAVLLQHPSCPDYDGGGQQQHRTSAQAQDYSCK